MSAAPGSSDQPDQPDGPPPASTWLGAGAVRGQRDRRRIGSSLAGSAGAHAAVLAVALVALQAPRGPVREAPASPDLQVVFLQADGSGGGGGGSPTPAPPRPRLIEIPKPEIRPIPLVPHVAPIRLDRPVDLPQLNVQVYTPDAVALLSSGNSRISLAPYGGTGKGPGAGDGDGPGLNRGRDGGFGDGAYGPDSGATNPVVVYREPLQYTSAAVHAKIQGAVVLEAVVLPDGTVGDVRITKSLDPRHGLDQEAIRTARLWRFRPGTLNGVPVAVIVTLLLDFRLH
jgi:TonB family protein